MKIKPSHWHHFFGGTALLLLVIQLLSGMVLTMFYSPHLSEAYASVQKIYNDASPVAWIRDCHRWAALLLFIAVTMHLIRSLLRRDFDNREGKTTWLTGTLLYLPLLGFLLTGVVLPWEWRGYWFMEMVPNYAGEIPLIGPTLSEFLIDSFTLTRALVTHIIVLPAITLVLMDIHAIGRIQKRVGGLSRYLLEHGPLAMPFLILAAVLAYALPMPSQDPAIIPMPLDGEGIPTAEWFILIFYVPYLYFKGQAATLFGFYLPLAAFLALAMLPYCVKPKKGDAARAPMMGATAARIMAPLRKFLGARAYTKALGALGVVLAAMIFFAPLYAVSHASPTMGCNSCHNLTAGVRMGLPPPTFKDRGINPNLKNNTFMVEHWFYPQVVW